MSNEINWERFQNKYFKLEEGEQKKVLLSNWRQENKSFEDSEKTRTALVFDVIRINNEVLEVPLEWSTTSGSLALEFKKLIINANEQNKKVIYILLKKITSKKYVIVDLSRPTEHYDLEHIQ